MCLYISKWTCVRISRNISERIHTCNTHACSWLLQVTTVEITPVTRSYIQTKYKIYKHKITLCLLKDINEVCLHAFIAHTYGHVWMCTHTNNVMTTSVIAGSFIGCYIMARQDIHLPLTVFYLFQMKFRNIDEKEKRIK